MGFEEASFSKVLPSAFAFSLYNISPPTSDALKRGSILQWGSCSDVKQMAGENQGCYLPGCQLFSRLYVVQEASCPSATRVPLGLERSRRTQSSWLSLTLWRSTLFHLRPMRWLLHIQRSFIRASGSNFTSPLLTAHLPLPSPPPWVWVASYVFSTKSVPRQCPVCGRQPTPATASVSTHGLGPRCGGESGELPWWIRLKIAFFFLLACQVERILNLQSEN